MRHALIVIVILAASSLAFGQDGGNAVFFQSAGPVTAVAGMGVAVGGPSAPVQGAPYSATITNELVQTLADGNRIVQTSTGTIARDSLGRTRQDAALPPIGNLSAANTPHIVFIRDPVAQMSYTLNLTDKTAQKMPAPPVEAGVSGASSSGTFFVATANGSLPSPPPLPPPPPTFIMKGNSVANDQAQVNTEDLGSQTIEDVLANGVRTTRTIPAGQIGNDKPIGIVTEVWTSPELKTIISSKRSDPRVGDQTFQLTNIVRAEPDPSFFTVPADFKILDGPQTILYRTNQ